MLPNVDLLGFLGVVTPVLVIILVTIQNEDERLTSVRAWSLDSGTTQLCDSSAYDIIFSP